MNKIISFSIWGSSNCYLKTSLTNISLRPLHFPDWNLLFYIGSGVDKSLIEAISNDEYCDFVDMSAHEHDSRNSLWRFNSFFSDDVVISRDCDSLLIPKDYFLVNEWLKSDKDFHIIRDHPKHTDKILAGMCGSRNGFFKKYKNKMKKFLRDDHGWGCDQFFLNNYVYPESVSESFIHSCNLIETDLGFGKNINFQDEEYYIDKYNISKSKWGYIGKRNCRGFRSLSNDKRIK